MADLVDDGAASAASRTMRVALLPLAQHSAHVYADDARQAAAGLGVELRCAANWGDRADLCAAFAERIRAALAVLRSMPRRVTVILTAHSLPKAVVDRGDPYERDVRAAAAAIAARRAQRDHSRRAVRRRLSEPGHGAPGPGGRPLEWLGSGAPHRTGRGRCARRCVASCSRQSAFSPITSRSSTTSTSRRAPWRASAAFSTSARRRSTPTTTSSMSSSTVARPLLDAPA